uniref:Uncharacterized protein n=1 Tax=Chromera velia CCMP2878 TaxID=1169474 RepID=A0A0G4F2E9_9ALVE|eukprot:Cvel_2651.t1-p1 / transcript=Cvel_2651.t1 / gene=Cvel_2651 / organism=Chromera_velia_CCMP2878 / gene_product=hypothetical protein / transcript_product=hypothetical protein / location=Cvel_scaffold105:119117-119701(-) / protein_length=195 / sequence_SO=supercontig / SO=protein_coding / is_pseudo=false
MQLRGAIRACPVDLEIKQRGDESDDANAAELLLGMSDREASGKRGLTELVVLRNGYISASVSHLLSSLPPQDRPVLRKVYSFCASRFRGLLGSVDDDLRFMLSAPLEEAYLWVLACQAVLCGHLEFSSLMFFFKCTEVKPGRIFPENNLDNQVDVRRTFCTMRKSRRGVIMGGQPTQLWICFFAARTGLTWCLFM